MRKWNNRWQRFSNCQVVVNQQFVLDQIKLQYGTVADYARCFNMSRKRVYEIIKYPHMSKDVKSLKRLADSLNLSVDKILK